MRIDVSRFVRLTFALSALGCEHPAPSASSARAPEPTASTSSAPVASESSPARTPAPSDTVEGPPQGVQGSAPAESDEAPANLAICRQLSPACEGMIEECLALSAPADPSGEGSSGQGFRPRVAEEIAACWNGAVRPPRCRTAALGNCVKLAVLRSAVEPTTEPLCDSILKECRQAGKKPTWTKDVCAHILSSMMMGRPQSEAQHMLGPDAGHCTLDYVLPYQPFARAKP